MKASQLCLRCRTDPAVWEVGSGLLTILDMYIIRLRIHVSTVLQLNDWSGNDVPSESAIDVITVLFDLMKSPYLPVCIDFMLSLANKSRCFALPQSDWVVACLMEEMYTDHNF